MLTYLVTSAGQFKSHPRQASLAKKYIPNRATSHDAEGYPSLNTAHIQYLSTQLIEKQNGHDVSNARRTRGAVGPFFPLVRTLVDSQHTSIFNTPPKRSRGNHRRGRLRPVQCSIVIRNSRILKERLILRVKPRCREPGGVCNRSINQLDIGRPRLGIVG